MKKYLLAVLILAMSTSGQANAQAHKGVPIAHTPVHPAKHVSPRVLQDYEDFVDNNPFLEVNGNPAWTRQNGLLVASVEATDAMSRQGVAVMRFKPQGRVVLFNFIAHNELEDER